MTGAAQTAIASRAGLFRSSMVEPLTSMNPRFRKSLKIRSEVNLRAGMVACTHHVFDLDARLRMFLLLINLTASHVS
jgi:hypothetical protein